MRASAASAKGLNQVLKSLALQVVRDGEGARKQVEVTVTGAKSARSAKRIALSIANSPLVKTAIAGEDANWGRVVMAVGKAGEPADRDLLSIWFGDIRVAHNGERDPAYSEEATSAYMKQRGHRDPRRYRARARQGHGVDLRPHQGICRDQRRLPELASCRAPTARDARRWRSVRRFEAAGFRAWPAASVYYDGTWAIRLTAGHPAKRLNSVNPLDPGDVANPAERIARAARRFAAYGRPLTFRMSPLVGQCAGLLSRQRRLVVTSPNRW